ncbi:hypothetical protein TEA_008908 [Camellia sinensis var. sinensis]|uniref:Uncharacterized protein n=1 Tax=Camellia sinensis var. sinensis TaxID=542762 RepID=A0A4S4D867_CAMSN|nr:hypothetical protein TEA_008908 [Camellia sinensis var. sinensis]
MIKKFLKNHHKSKEYISNLGVEDPSVQCLRHADVIVRLMTSTHLGHLQSISSVCRNLSNEGIRAANKAHGDGPKKTRTRDRAVRAMPAPDANAELQSNLDRRRLITHANAKSKSEKFPPPHQDGALGVPLGASHHIDPAFVPPDIPFSSTSFTYSKEPVQNWSGPLVDPVAVASRGKKYAARESTKSFTSKKDKSSNPRVKGKERMA